MKTFSRYILVLLVIASSGLFAQQKDPFTLLNNVKEKFNRIRDYKVEAQIIVDVNFLKVPESKATIYFKQPDKVKMESEGFALLPKQGLNFSPSKLLSGDYSAIYVKEDVINNNKVSVVKIIPNSDTTEVILSTVWIDPLNKIIRKIETTTKRAGTVAINLEYDGNRDLPLPSEVIFTFNVSDVQMPAVLTGEMNEDSDNSNKRNNKPMSGTVTIKYQNYKINSGIKDSFFEKDKK